LGKSKTATSGNDLAWQFLMDAFTCQRPNIEFINRLEAETKIECKNCSVELWEMKATTRQLAYLTHGFFRYYGKMPAYIPRLLIQRYSEPRDLVIDNMCGSGTTLVEAVLFDRDAIGIDINPLSCLISRVKCTPINDSELLKVLSGINESQYNEDLDLVDYIPPMKNLDHWFTSDVTKQLAFLRKNISTIEPKKIREFYLLAFASIIRQASNSDPRIARQYYDKPRENLNVFQLFNNQCRKMISAISAFNKMAKGSLRAVYNVDARSSGLDSDISKIIICHPPYFNCYRFSSIFSFEINWLGFNNNVIRKGEIKEGFKLGKPELAQKYLNDMSDVMKESYRLLKENGIFCLMIGDALIKGKRVQITSDVIEHARNIGFKIDNIIIRMPKFTEATYAAAERRKKEDLGIKLNDFIVVMRK
jgi:site-specific DNA-methyltransferase (cytosine-N4-specific)